MEPAEDWYRCDAADEDFFNSLLGRQWLRIRAGAGALVVSTIFC
jgi:hypothetical protein